MNLPRKILDLAEAVRAAGGRALLVGGCVRDALMGVQPKDWDLEIYGVAPEQLREILDRFGPVNVVGEAFTVYKLGADLDVSLPRMSNAKTKIVWTPSASISVSRLRASQK